VSRLKWIARFLTQNCSVSFVTATQRELVYHCLDDDTKTSLFFNIFDNLVVKPLDKSECETLVQSYLDGLEVSFTESEIARLIDLSGGYAAFFQYACSFLYYAYQNDAINDDEFKRFANVEAQFRLQATPQFSYFWHKSEEEEKIVLSLIALLQSKKKTAISENEIKNLYPRYKNDILVLENRSLVLKYEEKYKLFSPLFSEWILIELADISQKNVHLLDEWLTEYEKNFLQKGLDTIVNIKDGFQKVNPKYWSLFGTILKYAPDSQQIIDLLSKDIGTFF
jgi:hypothetical protein